MLPFGIQIGSNGITSARDLTVKSVMGLTLVLFTHCFHAPLHLAHPDLIETMAEDRIQLLKWIDAGVPAFVLAAAGITIVVALFKGMAEYRRQQQLASTGL